MADNTLCLNYELDGEVRRGAYASSAFRDEAEAVRTHRQLIEATVASASAGTVVSHLSAAVLHGIDVWNPSLTHVHLTIDVRAGFDVRGRRHEHIAPLPAEDVTILGGTHVTSVARTVVDCARTESFEKAVVLGDSALHRRLVTPAQLREALEYARTRCNVSHARQVVEFLDARSESVGESRSRVLLARLGLPRPDLQRAIHRRGGTALGRVDFYFEESGAVGEYDGMAKHQTAVGRRRLQTRDDELRAATGCAVAHWNWHHLTPGDEVGRRVRYAIAVSERRLVKPC